MALDVFDRAFLKCNKEEREAILNLSAEEFAKEMMATFKTDER